MNKNLSWKIILIIALVALAAWTLYPPQKTLKPGIDLGGGTSLIYEIDSQGLNSMEKRGLAGRMITVLRRRIDPANIQNLVWRPQGNTRFEVQMPLASKEAREKREAFESVLDALIAENVTPAMIMRSVVKPPEQRAVDFEKFAHDSNDRTKILEEFATFYDLRKDLQQQRDDLSAKLAEKEDAIKVAGLDFDDIQTRVVDWSKLSEDKLKVALLDYLGSEASVEMLTQYVGFYKDWALVVGRLTDPDEGINILYNRAMQSIHKLNLSQDQVMFALEAAEPDSARQKRAVVALLEEFPEREQKINAVVNAYREYYPNKGRLDDPGDIQRMLKGAGILEFRILPTDGHPEVDSGQMKAYVEMLKTKGPKYASDDKYIWFEIENIEQWHAADGAGRPTIVAQFGNNWYVLASNKKDEAMLHSGQSKDWKLNRASPGQDQQGRRAIDFELDERGGVLFGNVTGKNLDRPLCILLDDLAISAPNIQSRIYTRGQITGSFSQTEVQDMVSKLNAGSLPARLVEQPISVKTIGPSIGADNRDQGIKAGLVGMAGVIVCMLIYYTLAGSIADVALLMNLLFVLAIMAGLRATFTLPGIAGVILTIGMSVDANVLIFERTREEQKKGSSLSIAIKNGYEKAFSAIIDSNITTMMTAGILYWVASEEIKGFAITLILGLASSMFSALFVTRVIFDWLLKRRIIKDHLIMLNLVGRPNINWMKYRPVFLTISGIMIVGGLFVFFTRDESTNSKYDIEFTGGTSVQINLKPGVDLSREQVEERIHNRGRELGNHAIAAATVYSVGKTGREYEINTTETNRTVAKVTTGNTQWTAQSVTEAIRKAEKGEEGRLRNLVVTETDTAEGKTFSVQTSQLNKLLVANVLETALPDANISEPEVDEVVTEAVLASFEGELEVMQSLEPRITGSEKVTESMIESQPELVDFLGGAAIRCELQKGATKAEIEQRLKDLLNKPDMRELKRYPYKIVDSHLMRPEESKPMNEFVFVVSDPDAAFAQMDEDVWAQFVQNETSKVKGAMELETSLSQVTQIDPSVGNEAKTRAMVAIVLSLMAMLTYIGIRFGDLRYGFGAVITLAHDTIITLGAVTGCTYVAATMFGQSLLIGDFKIDLAMIAAFLTLLGYSINDTIVIYDRIRENRRKGTEMTPQIINNSINETLARTLLTSLTTLLVVVVMYIFGGKGLRGFNFALMFGIILGTYSSIAISAPILLIGLKKKKTDKKTGKG